MNSYYPTLISPAPTYLSKTESVPPNTAAYPSSAEWRPSASWSLPTHRFGMRRQKPYRQAQIRQRNRKSRNTKAQDGALDGEQLQNPRESDLNRVHFVFVWHLVSHGNWRLRKNYCFYPLEYSAYFVFTVSKR